jgi:predicted neutral ceramidase superfamily lipid hydrolase
VAKALKLAGYDLVEFCTSDSHNLAARGLTVERGYEALGEATPPASIAGAVVKMARLAESMLAPAEYGSAQSRSRVRVFGSKALDEFASITQSSLRFSKNYLKFAVATVAVLLLLSVFF